jgi:hypothetical protein
MQKKERQNIGGGWQGGKMSVMLYEVLYKVNAEKHNRLIYSRLVVEFVAQVVLQS